jgi:hypothetical protein
MNLTRPPLSVVEQSVDSAGHPTIFCKLGGELFLATCGDAILGRAGYSDFGAAISKLNS